MIIRTRLLQDEKLWATLAAMAAYAKNLNTAEIAYGAIDEVTSLWLCCDDFRTVRKRKLEFDHQRHTKQK